MNSTIFRRKLGLGVLIAFVLAFGMQSVADAVLRVSNSRGDLQVKPLVANQTFEFSFYISGVPGSRPDITSGTAVTARESITITPTDATITEVRMGSTTYSSLSIASGSTFTLTEWHPDNLNGSRVGDDTPAPDGTTTGDLTTGTVTVTIDPGTTFGPITVGVVDVETNDGDDTDTAFYASNIHGLHCTSGCRHSRSQVCSNGKRWKRKSYNQNSLSTIRSE